MKARLNFKSLACELKSKQTNKMQVTQLRVHVKYNVGLALQMACWQHVDGVETARRSVGN